MNVQMYARALVVLCVTVAGAACSHSPEAQTQQAVPAAVVVPSDVENTEAAIRFLEDKAQADPDDFIARNKLVGYYLQRLRETGSVTFLELASRAANESLASLPAERNTGGLAALAQVEFASHEFSKARDHALRLRDADPDKLYPLLILGDALLELGDYSGAASVYRDIDRRGASSDGGMLNAGTRLARLALLEGRPDDAERAFVAALDAAQRMDPAPRETIAWCYWQLGETAFLTGDYVVAEQRYHDALTTYPDYYRALASLARVRAAAGDINGAIEGYERVTRILPDPSFIAALGDLYKLAGRDRDAAAQYGLVEQIGRLSQLNGVLYNRQLALFRADHDVRTVDAFESATHEYELRRDIYGADAVAWTALKAGKVAEAQAAMKEAMRLGTKDSRLLYHAGMIALAAGDAAGAASLLQQALDLSPSFDPLQAKVARDALDRIKNGR